MVKRIALIRNGVVENVIRAELEFAQALGYDEVVALDEGQACSPGDTWDGAKFTPGAVIGERVLSRADFQRRFLPAEFFAVKQLAQTDANMAYAFGLFEASQEIRLDHTDTQQFVGYMQVRGILTAERAAAVLG